MYNKPSIIVALILLVTAQAAQANDVSVVDASSLSTSSLSVSSGHTLAIDFGTASTLSLTGDVSNQGTIYIFSSNPAVTQASVHSSSILNGPGALISTFIPAGLPGVAASHPLSLNLVAMANVVNYGTISSAGTLSVTAGNTISNISTNSSSAIMSAVMSTNLSAANIINSGLVQSIQADINLSTLSQSLQNLHVVNTAGTFAASGNINIGVSDILANLPAPNFAEKIDVIVTGGDFHGSQVEISGRQIVFDVRDVSGILDITGSTAHVTAATPQLQLGNMNLSGDPTFYNTAGDVIINAPLVFAGQPLAIVASRNIITAAGANRIDTSSAIANGGSITMVAGANFISTGGPFVIPPGAGDSTSTLTISGASATGGSINLAGANSITALTSQSTVASGGNISLVANEGVAGSGTINLPVAVPVVASGTVNNGNVQVIAGAANASSATGNIVTIGGAAGTGNVTVASSRPIITVSAAACNPCVRILAGGDIDLTAGRFVASAGNQTATISTGAISAGGDITLRTNGDTFLSSLTTTGTVQLAARNLSTTNSLNGNIINIITVNNGNITLGNTLTATASTNLNANGTGTIQQATGSISAPSVSLRSGTGSIGTLIQPLATSATNLHARTNGAGSVYLHNDKSITLFTDPASGNVSAAGSEFSILTDGSFTGNITTTPTITVKTNTGSNGNIDINFITNSLTLVADGSGNITSANCSSCRANKAFLASGSGFIGGRFLGGSPVTVQRFNFFSDNITVQTTGDIFINHNPVTPATQTQFSVLSAGNFVYNSSSATMLVTTPITAGNVHIDGNRGLTIGADITATSGVVELFNSVAVVVQAGRSISAATKLSVIGPIVLAGSNTLSSGTTLSLSGSTGVSIGQGSALTAGQLQSGTTGSGVLGPTQIQSAGSLLLNTPGSLNISSTLALPTKLTANGGDVRLTANGNITLTGALPGDGGLTVAANGGNIQILAQGTVSAKSVSNSFLARAVGVSSAFAGGGIEIGSGITSSSSITNYYATRTATFNSPIAASLGTNVVINNNQLSGVIQANAAIGSTINVGSLDSNFPTVLNLFGGPVFLHATGATSSIDMDPLFTTFSFGLALPSQSIPAPLVAVAPMATVFLPAPLAVAPPSSTTNTIISTDSTPAGPISPAQSVTVEQGPVTQSIPSSPATKSESGQSLFLATNNCSGFSVAGTDSFLTANSGTLFSVQEEVHDTPRAAQRGEKYVIVGIKQGRMLIVSGKKSTILSTAHGTITVPGSSATLVEQTPQKIVRVSHLAGTGATVTVGTGQSPREIKLQPGEELLAAGDALDEEELIPADGIHRELVESAIRIEGKIFRKSRFDLDEMFRVSVMINCNQSVLGGHHQPKSPARKSSYVESSDHLQPIKFAVPAALTPATKSLQSMALDCAVIRHCEEANFVVEQANIVNLIEGELLVQAKTNLTVRCGNADILIKKNTVVLVETGVDQATKVRNLWDTTYKAIQIKIRDKVQTSLAPGQEAIYTTAGKVTEIMSADSIARRRCHITNHNREQLGVCDYSLTSLANASNLTGKFLSGRQSISDARRIIKMHVILSMVTAKYGSYSPMQSAAK